MSAAPPTFAPVPNELDFPREEDEVLAFWRSERIFEKSLAARDGAAMQALFERARDSRERWLVGFHRR